LEGKCSEKALVASFSNYRKDLIRLTVTIRPKEKTRSLVRASLQYNIRAVEDPDIYQRFFKILGQSLFFSAKME